MSSQHKSCVHGIGAAIVIIMFLACGGIAILLSRSRPKPAPVNGESPGEHDSPMKSRETAGSSTDDDATKSQVNRATVRNPRLRAALVIIVLLLCSAVAILLLSSPTQREVHLDAFVERFSLPTNIALDLLELKKIHLRGVRIDLSRIASLRVDNDKPAIITTFPALSIKEKKDAATSSAYHLQPLVTRTPTP